MREHYAHTRPIAIALILILGYGLDAQQAWVQEKGAIYTQLGTSSIVAASAYNANFQVRPLPRQVSETIVSAYAEYGLTGFVTLSATLPFHSVSTGSVNTNWVGPVIPAGSLTALGNISTAATVQLFRKKAWVGSVKGGWRWHTATQDSLTGLRTGRSASRLMLSVLGGFSTQRVFASGELAYHYLTNGYRARAFADVQLGVKLLQREQLILILGLATTTSLGGTSLRSPLLDDRAVMTALYLDDQAYWAPALKAGYAFSERWTIWAFASGGAASNTLAGIAKGLALSYRLKQEEVRE